MNYSKPFVGIIAAYLTSIGLLNEAEALTFINSVVLLIPVLYAIYGRIMAGGVDWFGRKD